MASGSGGQDRRAGGARWLAPVVALAVSGCAAHLPRSDERVAFLEPSTISVSTDGHEAFEVAPAVHVLLWNGLDTPGVVEEGGTATALTASFLGTFRMWHVASTPIRTPTYEPRLMLQVFRVDRLGPRGAEPPALDDGAHRLLGALSLSVGHRSNGEEGCALADHVRTGDRDDFDCRPVGDPPSTQLNLENGSFTTNWAGVGAGLRWLGPASSKLPGMTAAVHGTAEWNLPCRFGACMAPEMRARYGAVLATWRAELEVPIRAPDLVTGPGRVLRVRATGSGAVHLGATRSPFGDVAGELAFLGQAPGGLDLGIFLRRHVGSDYLNIRFEERLDAWILGLVVEPSPEAFAPRGR